MSRADELREIARWHIELLVTKDLPAEIVADVLKECHDAEMEACELDNDGELF